MTNVIVNHHDVLANINKDEREYCVLAAIVLIGSIALWYWILWLSTEPMTAIFIGCFFTYLFACMSEYNTYLKRCRSNANSPAMQG